MLELPLRQHRLALAPGQAWSHQDGAARPAAAFSPWAASPLVYMPVAPGYSKCYLASIGTKFSWGSSFSSLPRVARPRALCSCSSESATTARLPPAASWSAGSASAGLCSSLRAATYYIWKVRIYWGKKTAMVMLVAFFASSALVLSAPVVSAGME